MTKDKYMGVDKYAIWFVDEDGFPDSLIKTFKLDKLEKAINQTKKLRKIYKGYEIELFKEVWQGTGSNDYELIEVK